MISSNRRLEIDAEYDRPAFLAVVPRCEGQRSAGTLLTLAGRRGPGYTLIWVKNGIDYSLVGFGDSSEAIDLASSLK